LKAIALLSLAASVSLSVVLSACASDQANIQDMDASAGGPGSDAAGNGTDGGNGGNGDTGNPGPQTCSSPCATDIECQNRCPQLDSGVYCCDLSMVCYPNASATCPTGPQDGGGLLPD
jgi:hypothetical protein